MNEEKQTMPLVSEDSAFFSEENTKSYNLPDNLLNLISEENPSGEHLLYEGTYDRIREARRADDPSIPQGVWEHDLKKANWDNVIKLCQNALETRTKDLQIAVWLTEALLCVFGFKGLMQGLKLQIDLCDQFWDTMYPEISDDDFEARTSPIIWMNDRLFFKLKQIPLTMPQKTPEAVSYNYSDWEHAEKLEKLETNDQELFEQEVSKGKVTRAKFLGSVTFTPINFYQAQTRTLNRCLVYIDDLNRILDTRCGKFSPSLKQFKDSLYNIKLLTDKFLEEKTGQDGPGDISEQEQTQGSEKDNREHEKNKISAITIKNRAEAYRILSAVADYLLIHEPHSPTPYLVKRAVSWGNMTLTELLKELVEEDSNLRQIFNLLGLKGPEI
ncbi:type VI secretion system protein TssA [Desulfobacterales bacterium HSG17]|nr:type VI secretion system protein TssA [Desulfobacterales bacterium HSG17]